MQWICFRIHLLLCQWTASYSATCYCVSELLILLPVTVSMNCLFCYLLLCQWTAYSATCYYVSEPLLILLPVIVSVSNRAWWYTAVSNGVEVTLNYIECFSADGLTAVLCNVVNQVIPYTRTHGKRSNRSNKKTVKGFVASPYQHGSRLRNKTEQFEKTHVCCQPVHRMLHVIGVFPLQSKQYLLYTSPLPAQRCRPHHVTRALVLKTFTSVNSTMWNMYKNVNWI